MEQKLTYCFPVVGQVSFLLYDDSMKALEYLKLKGDDERLSNTPHLGVVPLALQGVRHSRWDYVMFLCYVAHLIAQLPKSYGLGAAVNLSFGRKLASGEELLKCWAMLLNQGHCRGTFATEKAVMGRLRRSEQALALFREGLPAEFLPIANDAFREEDYYKFHYLLSAFLINTDRSQFDHKGLLLSILASMWVEPLTERITNLRTIYRAIRRLSYLVLDLEYSPVGLRVDFGQFLANMQEFVDHILRREPHPLTEALQALENYLYHQVYLSQEVSYQGLLWERYGDHREFLSSVENARTPFAFRKALRKIRRNGFGSHIRKPVQQIHYRLDFTATDPFQERIKAFSEAEKLHNEIGSPSAVVQVNAFAGLNRYFLDVFVPCNSPVGTERRIISRLFQRLSPDPPPLRQLPRHLKIPLLNRYLGRQRMQFMVNLLERFIDPDYSVRWSPSPGDLGVFSSSEKKDILLLLRKAMLASRDQARRLELKVLSRALKDLLDDDSLMTAAISRLKVHRRDNARDVAEIDGLWVSSSNRAVTIHVTEAKGGRHQALKRAMDDLRKKVRRLGFRKLLPSRNIYKRIGREGALVSIRVC